MNKYEAIIKHAMQAGATKSEAAKAAADRLLADKRDGSTEAIAEANKRAATSYAKTGGNVPTVPKTEVSKTTQPESINTRLANESDADYSRRLSMQNSVQQRATIAGGSSVIMDTEQAKKVLSELDGESDNLGTMLKIHEQDVGTSTYMQLSEEDKGVICAYMDNVTEQKRVIDAQREHLMNLVGTVAEADNAVQAMVTGTNATSLSASSSSGVTTNPWYTDIKTGKQVLSDMGKTSGYYASKLAGEFVGNIAQDKVLSEAIRLTMPFGKDMAYTYGTNVLPTKNINKLFGFGDVVNSMDKSGVRSGSTTMFGATTVFDAVWNKYKYDSAVSKGEMSEMDANFYTAGETLYDTGKNLGVSYLAWGTQGLTGTAATATGSSLLASAGSLALPIIVGVELDAITQGCSDGEYTNFCDLVLDSAYEKIVAEEQAELNNKLADAQMEYVKALEESVMLNQYREWGVQV